MTASKKYEYATLTQYRTLLMSKLIFDTYECIKRLTAAGMPLEQAKFYPINKRSLSMRG